MSITKPSALAQLHYDLFITALEGGIGYWSACTAYRNANPDDTEDVFGFAAEIIDTEEDPLKSYRIDRAVIAKGYRLATTKPWRNRLAWSSAVPPLVVGPETDWDFDASDADMIVQLGLFGDVRYG